ncbi:MAG: GNAT family N-acetyltransferase [Lachnospiraceae bacterium]|nr:GNAT family N-acetyltransferase [Lachnospiraceae bacterium]
MDLRIKEIEDMSLNAWPSHQMELYDGWILRFSYFYTHRTNSVEQFGSSTLPWSVKIPYCESRYARWHTPTIFKISPLVSTDFDYMLENRGYEIQHTTNVMYLDLAEAKINYKFSDVTVLDYVSDEWIQSLFALKNTTDPHHLRVVPSMYAAIPKDTICAYIEKDGQVIATGLGVIDRSYVGLYAIHVHEDHRHEGYARQICTAILTEARNRGLTSSYLQVVEGNGDARKLYEAIGYQFLYQYWFRVRP